MSTPYELRNASVFCTQDTKVCLTLTHLMLSKQQAFHALPLKARGPFIKDVRTKGGRGVSPKADIVTEVVWIYYYRSTQIADKGEGVQNHKNFADVLYEWSLEV